VPEPSPAHVAVYCAAVNASTVGPDSFNARHASANTDRERRCERLTRVQDARVGEVLQADAWLVRHDVAVRRIRRPVSVGVVLDARRVGLRHAEHVASCRLFVSMTSSAAELTNTIASPFMAEIDVVVFWSTLPEFPPCCCPDAVTLTRTFVPACMSRTNTSSEPFVSPATRFVARLENAT